MLSDTIIVTGGDALYYPLIDELRSSIIAATDGAPPAFGVLDTGLTAEQTAALRAQGAVIARLPEIPALNPRALRKTPHAAVDLAKPWLNRIFPGYDTIIWLDGDTWVQDIAAVRLIHGAVQRGALAIVPGAGRSWERQSEVRWLLGGIGGLCQMRSYLFKNGWHAGLPRAVLRDIGSRALLNCGVFGARSDAAHWAAMQAHQTNLLRHGGKLFTSDGVAVAMAVYVDRLPVELLPDTCNYIRPWRVDLTAPALLEYYYPYARVGIVHLAAQKKVRFDPAATVDVEDVTGRAWPLNLRFGHFQRMARASMPASRAA